MPEEPERKTILQVIVELLNIIVKITYKVDTLINLTTTENQDIKRIITEAITNIEEIQLLYNIAKIQGLPLVQGLDNALVETRVKLINSYNKYTTRTNHTAQPTVYE